MANAELEAKIIEAIEGTFDTETSMFTGEDLEPITNTLYDNDIIEWRLIDDLGVWLAYKSLTDLTGYVFFTFVEPDEMSKDDFIDFIIEIEDAYQASKGKVKFDA